VSDDGGAGGDVTRTRKSEHLSLASGDGMQLGRRSFGAYRLPHGALPGPALEDPSRELTGGPGVRG
jgi:hypothetical protein